MKRFVSLVTAVVASSLLWAAEPSSAAAATVGCGSTVVASTILTADLSCPGDGLTIAAPNVTLDLGGHTISGAGFGFGTQTAGVRLAAGAVGVSVRSGRVQGFGFGIDVARGADRADISGLSLVDDGNGVRIAANGSWAHGNRFMANGGALQMVGEGNRVEGNALRGNSGGIFAFASDDAVIVGNSIVGLGEHDPGITIGLSHGARVSGNSVSDVLVGVGIRVTNATGSEVSGNQVFGNSDGIAVSGSGARVYGNVVFRNVVDGIRAVAGSGVILGGNVALANGNLGIEAPGAVDAGGNRASGNGDPSQCVGVTCSA